MLLAGDRSSGKSGQIKELMTYLNDRREISRFQRFVYLDLRRHHSVLQVMVEVDCHMEHSERQLYGLRRILECLKGVPSLLVFDNCNDVSFSRLFPKLIQLVEGSLTIESKLLLIMSAEAYSNKVYTELDKAEKNFNQDM